MIDLRSDTKTKPTPAMRQAMASAEVGDEQEREDPTVLELERRAAELLGQEEAIYLPTAMMANEIALVILGERGSELIVDENAHIVTSELGGPARFAGLVTRIVRGERGVFGVEQVEEVFREGDGLWEPPTSLVSIENTHNNGGGRVWPHAQLLAVTETARELGLRLHLDGARLLNASVASGIPAAELARHFDTVTLCLSKGLGCPIGAVLAGSAELMRRARREKHAFGGAMRQAGIVAAAGIYALDHHVERLADDHTRARRLAEGLAERGLPVEPEIVETNFVQLDVGARGLAVDDAIERLAAAGVGLSSTRLPGVLRAVTHMDVTDDDVERAIELIPAALGALVRA